MKIAFLITYFYPVIGGAENNCYYLAKELAKKGHEVHVFTSRKEETEERFEKIRVHGCKEIFRYKYYLAFYPSLKKKLLKEKFDVIHVHGLGFLQHDRAIHKYKKKYPSTKIFCTPHGPFMALKKYSLLKRTLKRIYLFFIKRYLKNYEGILQVNPEQEKWLMKDYNIPRRKIKFLPNGITSECLMPLSEIKKKQFLKKYNLKNKFVISYLGRIQKYKGLDSIILVLKKARSFKKNLLFVGIGRDADDKERLLSLAKKEGCEKNILFTGEVSEEEKFWLLDNSEIFLFPSQWEAFGIAMLEAMARKNAIISTKTEGGKYLIESGKNGFLFNYGNTEELKEALIKLIKNNSLRKRIQEENFIKSKKFLWKDIAKTLVEIYRNAK
jgi:glycogen synthase